MPTLLLALLLAATPTTDDLEGTWCLVSVEYQGTTRALSESWTFAVDGALVIEQPTDAAARFEATWELIDQRISTSLGVTLDIIAIDDDAMRTEINGAAATFERGACE